MGILDRVKKLTKGRERQISQAVDKAGDAVNKRTGGRYAGHIDKVGDKVDDALGVPGEPGAAGRTTTPPPTTPLPTTPSATPPTAVPPAATPDPDVPPRPAV